MKINIDIKTINLLKQSLIKNSKDAVRLMIRSYGWGGPILGVVLDEQRSDDITSFIENIKFVVDKEEKFLFENVSVIYEKGIFKEGFKVIRNGYTNTSC